MNKKKVIGMIIGVIAFAILVAGATYAWLVSQASVTNGTYNLGTMNFTINYTKGTDVGSVPILSSPTTNGDNPAASLAVVASRTNLSAPGNITIYLNTDSSTGGLLASGALNYAICAGACSSTDLTAVPAANSGTITATGKKALMTAPLTTTPTTYNVYFWLDSAIVDSEVIGSTYSGYISAEAVQTDTVS